MKSRMVRFKGYWRALDAPAGYGSSMPHFGSQKGSWKG